jgi:hypothetical protein
LRDQLLLFLRGSRLLPHELRKLRHLALQRCTVGRRLALLLRLLLFCRHIVAPLHGRIAVRWRWLLLLLLLLLELLHELRDLLAHTRSGLPRRLLLSAPFDLVLLASAHLAHAQHAFCSFVCGRLPRAAGG